MPRTRLGRLALVEPNRKEMPAVPAITHRCLHPQAARRLPTRFEFSGSGDVVALCPACWAVVLKGGQVTVKPV